MTARKDVEKFLKRFKSKLKVFDVVFVGRAKNTQTLLDLELVPASRTKLLEQLEVNDYCEGPLEETMHGVGSMWVFGKEVSGTEIYIKVAMGQTGNSVICISFHRAEQTLRYPFQQS
ncbi:MAG: hypothetical protein WD355_03745 [Balneolaceae bacterium]